VSGSAGGSTSPPTSPGLPADTPGSGPKNTSYPVITLASGDSSPVVGHAMFASTGTWTGTFPITYAYQWKRCDPNDPVNGTCAAIPGANSSTYTPVPQDSGWRIRVAVQASNSDGRTTQNSEVTAVTVTLAPRATATPPITPGGTNQVDQPLSVATGTWAGSTPIAYTYSWRRCDPVGDLDSCVPIQGATSSSYTPTVADIGFSLRVWITGSNTAGSDTAITNHTFPIVDKPHFAPTATTQPTIAGVALPGRQLTADIGAYSGDAPIATPFQWFRCDAIGDNCHEIPGATKVVYFPGAADVGYTLRIYVFASNTYGKLVAKSEPTDAVAANPPHVRGKRIVGTNKADYLAGTGHDDVIIGLAGNDTITGGAGDDKLYGGPGNDVITGGAGADQIFGGRGSDTIHAADGERDVVDCGPGNDHAIVDKVDVVSNCEVVTVIP
jgi:Ca2+-binding RTX toxin-like protein